MGLNIATGLNRWVESSEAKILHAGRLNIGPRLILGFVFIILAMLAADAIVLWQFHVVGTQAERLNDIDQKLVAVLHLRLASQYRPVEFISSALVEKVDHEVGEEGARTVLNMRRVQRRVLLFVPVTAIIT